MVKPQWGCVDRDDLFFPEDDNYDTLKTDEAKSICAICTFRAECKELGESEEHGIWGGLTPEERRSLR